MGVIVRVRAVPASRGVHVIVGVGHGLVDVGRGGGRFSRGSGAGEGRGRLSDMPLLYVLNGLCEERLDRLVCHRSLPAWMVLGLGARVTV